jgi:carbonic anhydrase
MEDQEDQEDQEDLEDQLDMEDQERQGTADMKEEILSFNRKFVEEKRYEQYSASKYPEKKIAILTCMDTRLVELLPAALGLKNGDVKMIKNAGAMINAPFGSAVRSILVAIFELGVNEIMIIGHTDCGVQHIDSDSMIEHMIERGIDKKLIDMISYSGVDFDAWLSGFESVEQSVRNNVAMLKAHPLIPEDVRIEGFVIDSETGELTPVEEIL